MKMYVVSDNTDTLTGLRLAGISGSLVHSREELKIALADVVKDREIGIVLIVEGLAREYADIVDGLKLSRRLPLIVEIPDRHGSKRDSNFISNYIREAIGVKL